MNRQRIGAALVCAAIIVMILAAMVAGRLNPLRNTIPETATDESTSLPISGIHPDFTGPDRIALVQLWNSLHSQTGRDALRDGKITDEEMNRIAKVYNECLSVYGLQSQSINGGAGEAVVQMRGTLTSEQQTVIVNRCGADMDYNELSSWYHQH